MSIKTTKIRSIKSVPLKGAQYDGRPYPEGLWEPNYVGGWVGKTGSGKSTSLLNALIAYQRHNTFDKQILISPSALEDPKYDLVKFDDKYEEYSDALLKEIVQQQDDDIQEYKDHQEKLEVYNKFVRSGGNIKSLTDKEKKIIISLIVQDENGDQFITKPECKYSRLPMLVIVFDDLGSSGAYSNNSKSFMNSMACRCRHKNITMLHAVQHLYQLPRALRQQCGVMAIFRTKDHKILKELAKENSSTVTEDQFIQLYEKSMERDNPHDFLLCDFKLENFRRNYDELLTIS